MSALWGVEEKKPGSHFSAQLQEALPALPALRTTLAADKRPPGLCPSAFLSPMVFLKLWGMNRAQAPSRHGYRDNNSTFASPTSNPYQRIRDIDYSLSCASSISIICPCLPSAGSLSSFNKAIQESSGRDIQLPRTSWSATAPFDAFNRENQASEDNAAFRRTLDAKFDRIDQNRTRTKHLDKRRAASVSPSIRVNARSDGLNQGKSMLKLFGSKEAPVPPP